MSDDRDESDWVTFDVHATLSGRMVACASLSPEMAQRLRSHLFRELCQIEAGDPEVLALEHDLPGLCQRALDRQIDPLAEAYEVSGDDLWEDYWYLGAPTRGPGA